MALSKIKGIKICGITTVLPSTREDNLELSTLQKNEREKLVEHTGIRYRYIANKKGDAGKKLFQKGIGEMLTQLNWNIHSIDVLVVVTQTATSPIPSLACQLHGDMEFESTTMAYDINSGCSGFVYGLHTISQLLTSIDKENKRAILCCGDVSTALTEEKDLAVKPIFSDAISVVGLESKEGETSYFNLETIGSGKNAIRLEKGFMRMNGIDVFNYALKYVPNNIKTLLEKYLSDDCDPEKYYFHQANLLINKSIAKSIGVSENELPSTLYDFGNTASASIPLTLSLHQPKKDSSWVLLSGFGVGFSIASALIKIEGVAFSGPHFLKLIN